MKADASMVPAPTPMHLGPAGQRIFAILHATPRPPRASLLVCPPLLHEHARSYRLFSMLARALAEHDVAVLRFDYYGTGDSEGDDAAFSVTGACDDAVAASEYLAAAAGEVPMFVMGVRAGGIVAIEVATRIGASGGLLLWQPVTDWPSHLAELDTLDARLRATVPDRIASSEGSLMGFTLPAGFRAAPDLDLRPGNACHGGTIVIDQESHAVQWESDATFLDAPHSLTRWISEPEMGTFPNAHIKELSARIVAAMGLA